jgi:hypothetical protein
LTLQENTASFSLKRDPSSDKEPAVQGEESSSHIIKDSSKKIAFDTVRILLLLSRNKNRPFGIFFTQISFGNERPRIKTVRNSCWKENLFSKDPVIHGRNRSQNGKNGQLTNIKG